MIDSLPVGPKQAPVVLEIGKGIFACDYSPGRPAIYNPPELAEPEEPAELGPVFIWSRSKESWIPLLVERDSELEGLILQAADRLFTLEQENYDYRLRLRQ